MLSAKITSFAATMALSTAASLTPRQDCSPDFKICDPDGANKFSLGQISASWGDLYSDIVNLVSDYKDDDLPAQTTVDPNGPARRAMAFCCSNVSSCLLVEAYGIAMCWDRFTTNVFFPDGTYGTIVTGDFNTSDGNAINLVYGDYTLKDGRTGNIYNEQTASSMKPDTSTMTMPHPWTSSGVGSAIPATGLGTVGSLSTGTTIIPATTETAIVGESITLIATMTGCANCPNAYNTVIPGPTQPGGTYAASASTFTTGILTPSLAGKSQASTKHVSYATAIAAIFIRAIASLI